MILTLEDKPRYCQVTNCFREAIKKRGIIWVCEVHLHHTKWCKCKKCKGITYTGSVFVKKKQEKEEE